MHVLGKWALLVALCLPAVNVWAKDRVIVLAGQSNMMGRGKTQELPADYRIMPANVRYFYQGREHKLAEFALFGPEVSLAHTLASQYPNDQIILVKQAASGSLIQQWLPGQALYLGLLRQIGFASDDYPFTQVDAIVWMQGESDAEGGLPVATQYAGRLMQLVTHLRKDLQSPNSVFVFGEVGVEHPSFKEAVATMRKQQQVAQQQLTNALMVSTEGLSNIGDGIHYNAAGQVELGKRFAQALIQHLH
ncbi:MAG: hypothetical protein RI964_982 [Pseudomonadota bacterium]|jgi:lysophospholipase L1-like esterase